MLGLAAEQVSHYHSNSKCVPHHRLTGLTLIGNIKFNVTNQCSQGDSFWLIIVSMLWGCTNPLLKHGGKGIENVTQGNVILRVFSQLKFLLLNWRYMLPFLLNQSGSLLFYLTLANVDLSLAIPVTNSLAFLFTSLSAKMMGEKIGSRGTYAGMLLVAVGVSICVYSKS